MPNIYNDWEIQAWMDIHVTVARLDIAKGNKINFEAASYDMHDDHCLWLSFKKEL